DFPVLVAGDVDGDVIPLVRPELTRAHLLGAGHGQGEGHVLAALVLVGVDEHAADDDEDDYERNDDESARSAHANPPSIRNGAVFRADNRLPVARRRAALGG